MAISEIDLPPQNKAIEINSPLIPLPKIKLAPRRPLFLVKANFQSPEQLAKENPPLRLTDGATSLNPSSEF